MFRSLLRRFGADRRANVAMMFGLSLVPILIATGAGIDFARGVMVHQRMMQALDAAALAVGNATSKPAACASTGNAASKAACAELRELAQKYFDQNYDHSKDEAYGAPNPVDITIAGQAVTLSSSLPLKLTLLGIAPINVASPTVTASSTVVWGQTKLWVALVLDNSGSMLQGDGSGSKMNALKDAINNGDYGLLKTLKNAAAVDGDVVVGIVPFTRSVNMGLSHSHSAIDWGEWEAPPQPIGTDTSFKIKGFRSNTPSAGVSFEAFGPGDDCPFTDSNNKLRDEFGFYCMRNGTNSTNSNHRRETISSSTGDSNNPYGLICPGYDYGNANTDHRARFYNGCWTSTKDGSNKVTVSSGFSASCNGFSSGNCSCSGSGSSKQCRTQKWIHTWVVNNRNTWSGCVMDRQRKDKQTTIRTGTGFRTAAAYDYDASSTMPSSNSSGDDTQFPAENPASCLSGTVLPLTSNWGTLKDHVDDMVANGATNQGIGVAHGFQMLNASSPYAQPTFKEGTSKVMILFSDGLNTQNRWWGNGSSEGTTETGWIDDRMNMTCTAAKNAGIVIYSIYVHIGSNGSSDALEDCASSPDKYYDLTSASQIKDAFKDIAQKITNLRVSQ